jgi:hypothetical protein
MEKFIYALCDTDSGINILKSVMGRSEQDAKEKIINQYFENYDDLECDEWDDFLCELIERHGIVLSAELYNVEEI